MSLDQWQERLQSHFTQLASLRSYLDFPLFALEHGLTEDEFDEITDLLHAQLERTDGNSHGIGFYGLSMRPNWAMTTMAASSGHHLSNARRAGGNRSPLRAATNSEHGFRGFRQPTTALSHRASGQSIFRSSLGP